VKVMTGRSKEEPKDKGEEPAKKLRGRKPPEYKVFEDMLRRVVKAPPMRKQ